MKYQVEFKHLFCLRLLRSAYVTFLKTGCKYQNFITSGIYRTHYIHELINLSTCQSQFTLYLSMWDTLYVVEGSMYYLNAAQRLSFFCFTARPAAAQKAVRCVSNPSRSKRAERAQLDSNIHTYSYIYTRTTWLSRSMMDWQIVQRLCSKYRVSHGKLFFFLISSERQKYES